MKTELVELEPCPFDGGPADVEHLENGRWSVGCRHEECIGFMSWATFARKAEAITAWNTRQSASALEELLDGLEQYADTLCEHGKYSEVCGRLTADDCFGCPARTLLSRHRGEGK